MKIGDLVIYVPSSRPNQFKWSKENNMNLPAPGILIEEIEQKGTTSRMFSVRWHNGSVTEEWVSYLEPYKNEV